MSEDNFDRDYSLDLFFPGPRGNALQDAPFGERAKAALYRKLNKQNGVLSSIDYRLRTVLDQPMTSRERIVEYPYVYNHLQAEPPSSVLVAGGARSPVAYTLASMGYKTTVVDLDGYQLEHRNLTSQAADFTHLPFQDETFNAIVLVSVIEHVGMYSDDDEQADTRAFEELSRVLADDGELLFTTPFSKSYSTLPNSRVYSWGRIEAAIPDALSFSEYQVYRRNGEDWYPIDREETPNFDGTITAVFCGRLSTPSSE